MPPETVLAFDTSAAHCAAALLLPDGSCLNRVEPMAKGQAERLIPMLKELLAEAGISWAGISALAVGTGPGNFTGVRISVAAARGLSLGLGIPAIGVTIFDALAEGQVPPFAVVQDARRDEVYLQIFGAKGAGPAALVPRTAAVQQAQGLPLIGSAAQDLAPDLAPDRHLSPRFPLAEAIARAALARLGHPQPLPAPFYLRGADAAPPSDPPVVILDA